MSALRARRRQSFGVITLCDKHTPDAIYERIGLGWQLFRLPGRRCLRFACVLIRNTAARCYGSRLGDETGLFAVSEGDEAEWRGKACGRVSIVQRGASRARVGSLATNPRARMRMINSSPLLKV